MRIRDTLSPILLTKGIAFWRVQWATLFLGCVGVTCQLVSFARTPSRLERQPADAAVVHSPHQIPPGYILPAQLERTLSVEDARTGDAIEARIVQDVPLPNREKVPFRSVVRGSVLNVVRDEDETGVELTLRFDVVSRRGQNLPVVTSLRAMASSRAVHEAERPTNVLDESFPTSWANTIQIGGDTRYGDGGTVRDRWKEKVGKAVLGGGVLVYAKANPALGCDAPSDADKRLQALWLFSADACGMYGFKGVELIHNGQSAPVGEITLHFKKADMKLRAGTGMLLSVVSQP